MQKTDVTYQVGEYVAFHKFLHGGFGQITKVIDAEIVEVDGIQCWVDDITKKITKDMYEDYLQRKDEPGYSYFVELLKLN